MKATAFALLLILVALCLNPVQAQVAGRKPGLPPKLQSPNRIAVDVSGRLLITDHRARKVVTLDPRTSHSRRAFAVDGRPSAIGCLGNRVYVGNETKGNVQIFTRAGRLLGVLGGDGMVITDPTDLVIDPTAGLLFVVDGDVQEVKVFDLSAFPGTLLRTIGAQGTSFSDFQHPTGITVDPATQRVFVADYGDFVGLDPRVLVFGYDGTFQFFVSGISGSTPSHFIRPQGLAIGQSGHLFVTDAWFGQVTVMDIATGNKVGVIGTYGTGPGELKLPLDLVITGTNQDVYVTNNRPQRIEFFAAGGTL